METKRCLNNFIFIRLDAENDSIKLKNGTQLFIDCSFEPEKHAQVQGVVFGLPSHLRYTGRPSSMPWETPMEIKVGDTVIFYYLSVINALKPSSQRYLLEGKDRYIFIEYQFIYAVVREGKIIPVNGYVLIETIEDPSITAERERLAKLNMELVITEKRNSKDVTYGRVKYLGTPNRQYVDSEHTDDGVDISVGDVVLIRKTNDIPLQYSLHQQVNEGKPLLRVQRRNIMARI
jgi:co-chaperonin GroES (HSP10)